MVQRRNPWIAWPEGSDPRVLARSLSQAHEDFISTGASNRVAPRVRAIVLDSWRRCRGAGLDPSSMGPVLDGARDDVADIRRDHPLAAAVGVVERLLLESPMSEHMVAAFGDASGRLLWVRGESRTRSALAEVGFVEGSSWQEAVAGTNAPALALAAGHEVQVYASEHYSASVQPWSCTASPVRDLRDGSVLGFLDVTGDDDVASPAMLAVVRATVAAVESHLLAASLTQRDGVDRPSAPKMSRTRPARRLDVLGVDAATLRGAEGAPLSLRHAEILLMLVEHGPLDAARLAVLLHERDGAPVTVRAEVSRLRKAVGALLADGSPYRLAKPLRTDVADVRALIESGRVAEAVGRYRGSVLPRSHAPGVTDLRERLEAQVRAGVMSCEDAAVVRTWTSAPHGRDDWEAWRRLARLSEQGSAMRHLAESRWRVLERRLAVRGA